MIFFWFIELEFNRHERFGARSKKYVTLVSDLDSRAMFFYPIRSRILRFVMSSRLRSLRGTDIQRCSSGKTEPGSA